MKFGEVYGRGCFKWLINMAPEVGLEPTTLRLTAEGCSREDISMIFWGVISGNYASLIAWCFSTFGAWLSTVQIP